MQVFNLSMTFPASNFAIDVVLMIEQYMFCYIINFYPGCWSLSIEVAVFNLDPRMFGDDVVMAVQTLFHRRQAREIGIGHIRMTVLALNLFDTTVYIVAERNRLFRTDLPGRGNKEKVDKCTRENQRD